MNEGAIKSSPQANPVRVTVCMPSYNHAAYIGKALDCLAAQTYPHFKIIACDDGSRDGTYEILKEYEAGKLAGKLTVLTHPGHVNRGAYHTYNVCLDHVDTEFFVGHASDDFWDPDALEYWVQIMDKHPDIDFIYGKCNIVKSDGQPQYQYDGIVNIGSGASAVEKLLIQNPIREPTMVLRRCCIPIIQMNPEITFGDWYHNFFLFTKNKSFYYDIPLVNYRYHQENLSSQASRERFLARHHQVFMTLYHSDHLKDYPNAKLLLLIWMLCACKLRGETSMYLKARTELKSMVHSLDDPKQCVRIYELCCSLSTQYAINAFPEVLDSLSPARARRLFAFVPAYRVMAQYIEWRETAAFLSRLKILFLLLISGVSMFVLKNIVTTFYRLKLARRTICAQARNARVNS